VTNCAQLPVPSFIADNCQRSHRNVVFWTFAARYPYRRTSASGINKPAFGDEKQHDRRSRGAHSGSWVRTGRPLYFSRRSDQRATMIRHGCPATRSFRVSLSADDDLISLYPRRGCRKIRIQMIDDSWAAGTLLVNLFSVKSGAATGAVLQGDYSPARSRTPHPGQPGEVAIAAETA